MPPSSGLTHPNPVPIAARQVSKMVHAIKMGWIQPRKPKEDVPSFYDLWAQEDPNSVLGRHKMHVPAPKLRLPGHEESYNPPPEYLLSEEEVRGPCLAGGSWCGGILGGIGVHGLRRACRSCVVQVQWVGGSSLHVGEKPGQGGGCLTKAGARMQHPKAAGLSQGQDAPTCPLTLRGTGGAPCQGDLAADLCPLPCRGWRGSSRSRRSGS